MRSPLRAPAAPGPRAGGRDPADTKLRLLHAAGRLFAERGYSGTSLRAVTRAAGVSVSAANYHFGSKEALMLATLGRVVEPVNQARIERLDAVERAAGDAAPALEAVLEAFLAPAIERRDTSSGRSDFRSLVARLYSDPPDVVAAFKQQNFGPVSERFTAAVQRILPDRDPREIQLGLQLVVGMMVHVIAGQLELGPERYPGVGAAAPPADSELLASMVRFAAAGLRSVSGPATGRLPS